MIALYKDLIRILAKFTSKESLLIFVLCSSVAVWCYDISKFKQNVSVFKNSSVHSLLNLM